MCAFACVCVCVFSCERVCGMFDALFCLVSWDGFDVFPSFAHALLIRGLLPLVAASIHGEFQALVVAQTRKLSWNGATIKSHASEKHRSPRQV